jgi:hypothetical protein
MINRKKVISDENTPDAFKSGLEWSPDLQKIQRLILLFRLFKILCLCKGSVVIYSFHLLFSLSIYNFLLEVLINDKDQEYKDKEHVWSFIRLLNPYISFCIFSRQTKSWLHLQSFTSLIPDLYNDKFVAKLKKELV